jgi:hypothetical protein
MSSMLLNYFFKKSAFVKFLMSSPISRAREALESADPTAPVSQEELFKNLELAEKLIPYQLEIPKPAIPQPPVDWNAIRVAQQVINSLPNTTIPIRIGEGLPHVVPIEIKQEIKNLPFKTPPVKNYLREAQEAAKEKIVANDNNNPVQEAVQQAVIQEAEPEAVKETASKSTLSDLFSKNLLIPLGILGLGGLGLYAYKKNKKKKEEEEQRKQIAGQRNDLLQRYIQEKYAA